MSINPYNLGNAAYRRGHLKELKEGMSRIEPLPMMSVKADKKSKGRTFLQYWSNGKLKLKCRVVNGLELGIHREWYSNGRLNLEKHFVNGEITSLSHWDRKGKFVSKAEYGNHWMKIRSLNAKTKKYERLYNLGTREVSQEEFKATVGKV